jgi:hypothetical protein
MEEGIGRGVRGKRKDGGRMRVKRRVGRFFEGGGVKRSVGV